MFFFYTFFNIEEAINKIKNIEKWLEKNLEETVKKAIAEKLLELKNKQWLPKNQKEFTLDEMYNNIILIE